MEGLLKYNYAEADATGVAHDNIDAILTGNKLAQAYNLEEASNLGTIGPNPAYDDEGNFKFKGGYLGEGTPFSLLDLMGLGAAGRVSKAAVTGGSSIFPRLTKNAKWLQQKELSKADKRAIAVGRSGRNWNKFNEFFKRPSAKWHSEQNKINASRIAMEKALDKFGIKHGQAVNDPITEILRALKYRKN